MRKATAIRVVVSVLISLGLEEPSLRAEKSGVSFGLPAGAHGWSSGSPSATGLSAVWSPRRGLRANIVVDRFTPQILGARSGAGDRAASVRVLTGYLRLIGIRKRSGVGLSHFSQPCRRDMERSPSWSVPIGITHVVARCEVWRRSWYHSVNPSAFSTGWTSIAMRSGQSTWRRAAMLVTSIPFRSAAIPQRPTRKATVPKGVARRRSADQPTKSRKECDRDAADGHQGGHGRPHRDDDSPPRSPTELERLGRRQRCVAILRVQLTGCHAAHRHPNEPMPHGPGFDQRPHAAGPRSSAGWTLYLTIDLRIRIWPRAPPASGGHPEATARSARRHLR